MDEKKTYLINIESNLKEYSEQAAEAKKKVDELTIANVKLQASETATAAEKEAGLAALKNANDEYRKAASLVKAQISANNSEVGSRKQLSQTLKLQEQALGKLGDAYIKDARGMDVLNPKYIEQRNQIAATKQKIIDYDLALKDGRSNIGRYGDSVKSAFADAGKSILSMISPMALVTAGIAVATKIFGGLKDALLSTGKAMDVVNVFGQMTKQIFYDIAVNGKLSAESIIKAGEAANLMNEKRKGDRQDMVEFASLQRKIAIAEFDAADKTKTRTEREESLNKAIALQNELTDKKLIDAREDLRITEELIKLRPKDDKLRDQYAKDVVNLINLDKERFEQSKRNEGKVTGLEKEARDERVNALTEIFQAGQDEIDAENERNKKRVEDRKKQDIIAEKAAQDFIESEMKRMDSEAEAKWNSEVDLQRKIYEQNRAAGKAEYDARIEEEKALAEAVLQIQQSLSDSKINLAVSVTNLLNGVAGENKALQNASLIADKAFAIAEIVIQTTKANAAIRAMTAASVLPGPGYLIRLGAAMAAAMVPINLNRAAAAIDIAAIIAATITGISANSKSNSSGGGSSIQAPTSISTSVPAQRAFANPVGSTILTQPQLTQPQLNALPNQNLLTAQDIANALSNMPSPIVTVEDINAKSASKKKVEVRATI